MDRTEMYKLMHLAKRIFHPVFILSSASITLIARSFWIVFNYYYVPVYWDEWEIAKFLSRDPGIFDYMKELFSQQNEHIIASTKLILFLDYYIFALTNLPMVAVNLLLALIVASALAYITISPKISIALFVTTFLVFSASGVALIQWENLVWAFQPQFLLVLVGALCSILLTLRFTYPDRCFKLAELIALGGALGFCFFSMGNGVAIPLPIIFLLYILGAKRRYLLLVVLISLIYSAAFFMLTRHNVPVGDQSLKTVHNILVYFVTVLGNPFAQITNTSKAFWLGLMLLLILGFLFIALVIVPFMSSRGVDRRTAALFALAGFLFATAAAIAWGRTSLGIEGALSSRYTTPMLVLWMTTYAILIRFSINYPKSSLVRSAGPYILLTFALASPAISSNQENVEFSIKGTYRTITQAGYFILSGVTAPGPMSDLYPVPDLIQKPIEMLRTKRLNIFDRSLGLAMPQADIIQRAASSSLLPNCPRSSVDQVSRLAPNMWQVSGWATGDESQTPLWIIGFDPHGQVLGFTPPLTPRYDVAGYIHARGEFNGFLLPLRVNEAQAPKAYIVAVLQVPHIICRIGNLVELESHR